MIGRGQTTSGFDLPFQDPARGLPPPDGLTLAVTSDKGHLVLIDLDD